MMMNCRALESFRPGWRLHRRQAGFSLVELMVTVAISLFMMVAFVAVFINMKRSFTSQDQLSQMQDNERVALTMLTSTVQAAGYFPDPMTNTAAGLLPDLPAAGGRPAMLETQSIVGTVAAGSDTLTVRHAAAVGDHVTDCFGRRLAAGAPPAFVNTFSVDTATNELRCSVNGGVAGTLVSNVRSLRIAYLTEGTIADTVQYVPATAVTDWTKVRMVRVTVTFLNPIVGTGSGADILWVQNINMMNRTS
jgi:type IV pilus assembly protein PilW